MNKTGFASDLAADSRNHRHARAGADLAKAVADHFELPGDGSAAQARSGSCSCPCPGGINFPGHGIIFSDPAPLMDAILHMAHAARRRQG